MAPVNLVERTASWL